MVRQPQHLNKGFPSKTPTDPQSIHETTQILVTAKTAGVRITPTTVEDTGNKFIEVAKNDPTAWSATLAFLDYRSFLNADFVPSVGQLTPATGNSKYSSSIGIRPNPDYLGIHRAFTVSSAGGYAPSDKSARMERLNEPQPKGSEFAFFVLDGGVDAVVLDGEYLKHVIIRNSDVIYDGGPLRLEDVYCVNCTFRSRFKLTPGAIDLSQQILAVASVSFTSKG